MARAIEDGDIARRFTAGDFDDDVGPTSSPGPLARHSGVRPDRRSAPVPPPLRSPCARAGRPSFLTLDGVFYFGDIWLDGDYLGATEGYFFPHAFETTEAARTARRACARRGGRVPAERDRTAKRTITGVFSHWDNLDPEWNPGGIWRPVRIVETGPVRIKWLRVLCREANEERGRLSLEVTLDPGEDPQPVPLAARLLATRHDPDGAVLTARTAT